MSASNRLKRREDLEGTQSMWHFQPLSPGTLRESREKAESEDRAVRCSNAGLWAVMLSACADRRTGPAEAMMGSIFIVFISFAYFALLNILTGAFSFAESPNARFFNTQNVVLVRECLVLRWLVRCQLLVSLSHLPSRSLSFLCRRWFLLLGDGDSGCMCCVPF